MTLRVAIVGCGKIADGHVQEVQKLTDEARLVAVCDREMLLAEQLAVRYGIPRHYDDFSKLLEVEKPDVVHITTPPESHLRLGKLALEAGCHIYVEKPFALSRADAADLIAAAERADRRVTVGYFSYFDPPALAMRELIAAGVAMAPAAISSRMASAGGSPPAPSARRSTSRASTATTWAARSARRSSATRPTGCTGCRESSCRTSSTTCSTRWSSSCPTTCRSSTRAARRCGRSASATSATRSTTSCACSSRASAPRPTRRSPRTSGRPRNSCACAARATRCASITTPAR